jgi:hypothetical protein
MARIICIFLALVLGGSLSLAKDSGPNEYDRLFHQMANPGLDGDQFEASFRQFFQEEALDEEAIERAVVADPDRTVSEIIAEARKTRPALKHSPFTNSYLDSYLNFARENRGRDISLAR